MRQEKRRQSESPVLEVGFRLTGSSAVEAFSRVGKTFRLRACITMDHGVEFTSRAPDCWALENQVQNQVQLEKNSNVR